VLLERRQKSKAKSNATFVFDEIKSRDLERGEMWFVSDGVITAVRFADGKLEEIFGLQDYFCTVEISKDMRDTEQILNMCFKHLILINETFKRGGSLSEQTPISNV